MAIQDRVVRTKNYDRHILKSEVVDRCRKCNSPGETIEHVTAGCRALAEGDYLNRHNQLAKVVHSQLAFKHGLIAAQVPYYKYVPEAVLESKTTLLYWDRPITTDKTVDHNRPDLLLIEKAEKRAWIIDIGVPLTANLVKTESEKRRKYQNLAMEVKRMWKLGVVNIVPLITSVEGVYTTQLKKNLETIGLSGTLASEMQKAAVLQTCHLVRKFLSF